MPNWIRGSLKLRGTYENIKRFFMDGIMVYRYDWETSSHIPQPQETWLEVYDEPDDFEIDILNDEWAHVEGTQRAFITNGTNIHIEKRQKLEASDDEPIIITVCEIQQAWSFKEDDWIDISKKYGVDLKLYGIEAGTGITEEMIIINGNLLQHKVYKYGHNYDQFLWDCPIPWFGG